MKYFLIILSFLILNCDKKNENKIECLGEYLSQKQISSVGYVLNYFDKYLKINYPNETNENERIYKYIIDFELNILSKEKNDIHFKNSLYSFNPYIEDLEKSGFFDLVKSENFYNKPLNLDEKVKKWADSIVDSIFIEKKNNFITNIQDPIIIKKSQSKPQRACGYINVFIYALSKCSPQNSTEQELISKSVDSSYIFILLNLKDKAFRSKLTSPTIKAFIFYDTVLKLYDCEDKKLIVD